jgi:hypothetical protein
MLRQLKQRAGRAIRAFVWYETYFHCEATLEPHAPAKPLPADCAVAVLDPAEIHEVIASLGQQVSINHDHWIQRFALGHVCIVLRHRSQTAAFGWVGTERLHPGTQRSNPLYRHLGLPSDAALVYNAFTSPPWRGHDFNAHVGVLRKKVAASKGKKRLLSCTACYNTASLKAQAKAGFRIIEKVVVIEILGRRFFAVIPCGQTDDIREARNVVEIHP